ncbi:MAG: LysM peptidoglycan-binding domain-containing protein [Caldilineaceae bacterium]|nr:LysM peptidoglycan-binding domain-containing protein [Caldilineaceae bacterium]MBP8110472.1 LysM peptidoglycan-binding domain-containing protein [Caldilineaceae bacterium]MBP8125501.1 LysM peptidoglycan-binding domain-containing protein [Caldilineaceae bacterium]MBP9074986.1 LysM peptidoglycan-binding domain-containing protein [Caldilineaceae bacterium]
MNKIKMTRTATMALILVVLLISASVFVSAQTTVLRSTSVTGELAEQYSQNWLGITPDQPSVNLRFTLTFYPTDNSEVVNNFGFWVLDENDVSSVVRGGPFRANNVAAGERTSRDPLGQLSAQVTASGLANYTVVVYNNSTTPVEYTLTLENGMIVDDAGQVKDASGKGMSMMADTAAATETVTGTVAATITTVATVTDVDMDAAKAAATTYTVVSGDTLGSIATATYGNVTYYKGICSFNELTNCNLLEVGQELLLPEVAVLDALAGVTTTTTTTAAATPAVTATATTTETVVAETVAVVATPAATTLTPGEGVTYTVVSGDTLATIALAAYGDLNLYTDLCTFNTIANCDVIEIGDVINLPALDVLTAK